MDPFQAMLGTVRFVAFVLTFLLMSQGCVASRTADAERTRREASPNSLSLRKADGLVVDVPRSGALADERALALAQAIADFDMTYARGDPFQNIGDPGLRNAATALATELRNGAVDQLDLTYRVARRTSSGLDRALLAQGEEIMRRLNELVARPPTKLYVTTQITSRVDDVSIHYMPAADYRKKSGDWMGYTFGQNMKIGVYVFRLQKHAAAGEPLFQKLEIMADPVVMTLDPAGQL